MKIVVACSVAVALIVAGGRAMAQAPAGGSQAAGRPPSTAAAKPAEAGRPHSFELTASVLWLGSASLGTSAAHETSNDSSGSPYTLFTATGEMGNAAGVEARLAYHVTRVLAVEGGVTWSRPPITFTIANDAEGAASVTGTGETLTQLFADVSLVGYLPSLRFSNGRGRPFLEAGVGYLRQLHGQTSATSGYFASDTGQVYHVGGGVRYFFRPRGTGMVKGLGLRLDARVYVRHGGYSFNGSNTTSASLGGGAVVAF